jgi:hypothetical protein
VSACGDLARIADSLGTEEPRDLIADLAQKAAGIPRSGPGVLPALLAGGRTRLVGGGFRPELRDHSASQARHFAGVARAVTVLGARRTEWLSVHLRRDRPDSPDGLLTTLGVRFATDLLDGTLAPADAGDWIRTHVCGR